MRLDFLHRRPVSTSSRRCRNTENQRFPLKWFLYKVIFAIVSGLGARIVGTREKPRSSYSAPFADMFNGNPIAERASRPDNTNLL